MDVPARQAFVMSVVPPDERAAASSVTNVPRSLASAATPLIAGVLLARSTFGWPLLIAGTVKIAYDLMLLFLYRDVPEESAPPASAARSRRSGERVHCHRDPRDQAVDRERGERPRREVSGEKPDRGVGGES